MDKLIMCLKVIAMNLTFFIIISGLMLLVTYGYKWHFALMMLIEVALLIAQVYYFKKSVIHPALYSIYILPFPIVYIVTLFG